MQAYSDSRRTSLHRRAALRAASAAAIGALFFKPESISAQGQVLHVDDPAYRFADYEGIVNRPVTIRQVYQWSNLLNPTIYGNIGNGMNAFQFAYHMPPDQVQVVVQAYYTANVALYDDYIWQKYSMGGLRGIRNEATGEGLDSNPWYTSNMGGAGPQATDENDPFYTDYTIQGLQKRGVLFLI